jgi:hypothetical protein
MFSWKASEVIISGSKAYHEGTKRTNWDHEDTKMNSESGHEDTNYEI